MNLEPKSTHLAYLPRESKLYEITIFQVIDEGEGFIPHVVYRFKEGERWFYRVEIKGALEVMIAEREKMAT